MTKPTSSRESILAKMPQPTGEAPPDFVPLPSALKTPGQLQARLAEELKAVGAKAFIAADAAAARSYVEGVVNEKGGEVVVARRPAVAALQFSGPRFHCQGAFPAADATVSVTQVDYAIAETGTLGLFSEEGEGRTLSLLAPVNIAILPASRIVANLAELLAREPEPATRSSALVFVTGPSRTADIELTLTVGVHGPGELHVVILKNL